MNPSRCNPPLGQILQMAELLGHVLAPSQGGQYPARRGRRPPHGSKVARYSAAASSAGTRMLAMWQWTMVAPASMQANPSSMSSSRLMGTWGLRVPGGGAVQGHFDDDGRGVHDLRVPSGVVSREWKALWLVSLASATSTLDVTLMFVAYPEIIDTFSSTPATQVSWVINAYNIMVAALLIPGGTPSRSRGPPGGVPVGHHHLRHRLGRSGAGAPTYR